MKIFCKFQMMHKSQFQKIDPYGWCCGPGSHIYYAYLKSDIPYKCKDELIMTLKSQEIYSEMHSIIL